MTKYPKLPTTVDMPGGAIAVQSVDPFEVEGQKCWGAWDQTTRVIRVDKTLPPAFQWSTYFHELIHAAIMDAGLDNLFSIEIHEALCDALATARMREKFG